MKEFEMFPMLKNYFEIQGYKINAEVKGCDLTASKDDELIIVEMKTSLNITLLYQAMDRKKLTPNVYIAVPKPKRKLHTNINKMKNILTKLQIGLLIVDVVAKDVFCYCTPETDNTKINYKKKAKLIKEIGSRNVDENVGGVNKTKILTGYKEKGISLCCALNIEGIANTKTLREKYGFENDATTYLNANFFGWFDKVDRATYTLSNEGKKVIKSKDMKNAVKYYNNKHYERLDKNTIN